MSDAPKVIYLHHADLVKNDGTQCLVFTSPAPANFTNHQSQYHHDDIVTALQAKNERLRFALKFCARGDVTVIEKGKVARAALQQET